MEFWNSLLTEKSQKLLMQLKSQPIKFILIGGWAVWLYTKQQKSKDIDIVLKEISDIEFFKNYSLNKNNKLKKYEAKFEEIDVDIYVPYFSKLILPVEDLPDYATNAEGFEVVIPEALLILKQGAVISRGHSIKGAKDKIDIMTILCLNKIDFEKYNNLLKKYGLEHLRENLKSLIKNFDELKYVGLNLRQFKLKKQGLLKEI